MGGSWICSEEKEIDGKSRKLSMIFKGALNLSELGFPIIMPRAVHKC